MRTDVITEDGSTFLSTRLSLNGSSFDYWDGHSWRSAENIFLSRKLDVGGKFGVVWWDSSLKTDQEELKKAVIKWQPSVVIVRVCNLR